MPFTVQWSDIPAGNPTTGFNVTVNGTAGIVQAGDACYVFVTSRDHTAGTARVSVTDNEGGGAPTWSLLAESTDRKASVWYRPGTSSFVGKNVTVSGCVGSAAGGLLILRGNDTSGDPNTNISVQDNASGTESHTGFTPDVANSYIVAAVFNTANDNAVTNLACTDPGTLTVHGEVTSGGGSDCGCIFAGAEEAGGGATGNFTWSQTNGTTKSIVFAVKPPVANPNRRAKVTFAEVEVPNAPRRAKVTWSEVEVPSAPRRAKVTWSEVEVPTAPRRAKVTWAEAEVPNAPRRAKVTWAELEVPDFERRAKVTWTELEVPTAPRRAKVTFTELEVPTAPRRAKITWSELEVPDAPLGDRRAKVTWSEVEVPDAPRRVKVTWVELETPDGPRRVKLTWSELEVPTAPRRAKVTWSELEVPDAPCSGTTYYVDTASGDNGNPGTEAEPFATIQHAVNQVVAGDTIIVEDGTTLGTSSSSPIVQIFEKPGTASCPITLKARNIRGHIIDGNGIATSGIRVNTDSPHWIIQGFVVRNIVPAGAGSTGITIYGTGSTLTDITIRDCDLHTIGKACTDTSIGQNGIFVGADGGVTDGVVIERCRFWDIGRFGDGESGCTNGNTNWHNHDHGIYVENADNVTIRNCQFWENIRGWSIQRFATSGHNSQNLLILNNSFAFPNPNRNGHITISTDTTGCRVENNLSYDPTTAFVTIGGGTHTSGSIKNNLTFGGVTTSGSTTGFTVSGNIENTDPLIRDTNDPPDFRLQAGSPAHDAGLTLSEVTDDFDGVARPQDSAYDIGAFETGDRRLKVTWAELEVPNAPAPDRRAKITWTEVEVPTAPRRAKVVWAEVEVPTAPRRAKVVWTELEVPSVPRRAKVVWAEVEVPDSPSTPRRAFVSWAELEVPDAARRVKVTFAELEVPEFDRRAKVTWAVLQVPDIPTPPGETPWINWAWPMQSETISLVELIRVLNKKLSELEPVIGQIHDEIDALEERVEDLEP